jgi:tetratricopeptide (TPR) repeat protein
MRQPARRSNSSPNAKGSQAEVRKLRDDASVAVVKKRYYDALECCLQLEELQPDEPTWARRAAYCLHRLGRRSEECAALIRAAKGYERAGFGRKASAMYRLALALSPKDEKLKHRLGELDAGRATGLDRLQPHGVLRYMTPSEVPPKAPDTQASDASPDSVRLRPPRLPTELDGGSLGGMEAKLIDEYELVEFVETDVESE